MLILIVCGYFYPINVFIWQKSHFVDKYVQNAKFSKWQKSNLHRALRGRTITAPHKSIEYIGLHMTIFLQKHNWMKLFTDWFVEICSGTLLSSIYSIRCIYWFLWLPFFLSNGQTINIFTVHIMGNLFKIKFLTIFPKYVL